MALVINANICYVYRHVRLDKNIPFYVGIGSDNQYSRAYFAKKRNLYWNKIVATTNYKVEILMEDLSWNQACDKEKEFILLYGRHDLGKGCLANMTDGGEGSLNVVQKLETRSKRSEKLKGAGNPNYGKSIPEWHKEILRKAQTGRKQDKEAVKLRTQKLKGKKRSKEVMLPCIIAKCKNIIDLSSGIIFDSISEAAASKKINRTTLNAMLRGQNKNTTSLIYI